MSDTFTCPRRGDPFAYGAGVENDDHWITQPDPYHMSPTCDYCGSISPDAFFAAIAAGAEIGPTDKYYKLYVEVPNPTPDAMRVIGGSSSDDQPTWASGSGNEWKRESEMTDDEFELAKACGWLVEDRRREGRDHWILFGPAGPVQHGKFYLQHLDDAGKDRFIDLVNAHEINFGYPGYLYVPPFFATPRAS